MINSRNSLTGNVWRFGEFTDRQSVEVGEFTDRQSVEVGGIQ